VSMLATGLSKEFCANELNATSQPEAIRGEIISILTSRLMSAEKNRAISDAVVRALIERGQFYFHTERKDFDASMFFDKERKLLERVRSHSFLAWLSDWLRVNRADRGWSYIMAEVETVSLTDRNSIGIIPARYWARKNDAIYISNGDGAMVRVTSDNVETVDNGTDEVLFESGYALAPWNLTEPADPFETCSLFREAKYAAKHGLDLTRLMLLSMPTNPPCKPPLCFVGAIGSGKTRTGRGFAEFFGIPEVVNKVDNLDEENFWVSVNVGGFFILDNADTRNRWLADTVSSHATGSVSQRRKLYSNQSTWTLKANSWVCLTTANPTFAGDAALADRLFVVRMDRRTDATSDEKLSEEIRSHRDSGLSFVAQTLSKTLADKGPVQRGLNQRHPDFADNAVRIGRALGRESEVIAALCAAESDKSRFCVENDIALGPALLGFMSGRTGWEGTAKELLDDLQNVDGNDMNATDKLGRPLWSARRVGKRLNMLWPHLEKMIGAKQTKDRNHTTTYYFEPQSAEFAEC